MSSFKSLLPLLFLVLFSANLSLAKKQNLQDADEELYDNREDHVESLEEMKSDEHVVHADEDDSYNYGTQEVHEDQLLDEQLEFNFEPSDILNLQVPAWSDEEIFDDIDSVPETISGGFYTTDSEESLIDFYVHFLL